MNTGLQFILAGGSFIRVSIPEGEALNLMSGFKVGSLKEVIGGKSTDGVDWAIRSASIIGIHTFNADMVMNQQPPAVGSPPPQSWGGLRR